jgi:hypothetical protein
MPGDTVVMVRAGDHLFAAVTSFARVPVPGEHVLLWLTESQRAHLGAEFGFGKAKLCVPAVVRDTVLRQKDRWRMNMPGLSLPAGSMDHIADLFVDAVTNDAWRARTTRWGTGGDTT